jgi:UPF0755 protein
MTIRGGGSPRDERSQAHPLAAEPAPSTPSGAQGGRTVGPTRRPANGDGRSGNGYPRNGSRGASGPRPATHGPLRFAIFLVVLVGITGLLAVTVLRPVASAALAGWALDNPSTWQLPFVGGIVEDALADELAAQASDDPSQVEWEVRDGDTVTTIGDRLLADGLIRSRPAFEFAAMQEGLGAKLEAGTFELRRDMTPPEVVDGLIENRIVVTSIDVTFREGLRLEQMTAKLQTIDSAVDPKTFYDLVTDPPASLLADYPWLQLPDGASLEGYLYPATYALRTDSLAPTSAEELVRAMLDEFLSEVGPERMDVAKDRGLTFREVLVLASIVEREAALDEERPLIAGVYQNRLDKRPYLLNADPTVIYASDTVALRELPFDEWKGYTFWKPLGRPLADVDLPEDLAGYNTYRERGLVPGPIASPTVASIDAALAPDTATGYYYFVLIPDSGGQHDFSKTFEEHKEKLRKYGYS